MTRLSMKSGGTQRAIRTAALLVLLAPALAVAQDRSGSVSPAAPMDFTKPQFDTETPQYDVGGQKTQAAKTVVAEVDGRAITLGQVGDVIRELPPVLAQRPFDTLYEQTLSQLIQRQALVIRAHQSGLDDDPDIRRRVQAAVDRVLSDAYVLREVNADITEQMLRDKYNELVAGRPGPEEVRLRLILVGTEREALELLKELHGNEDFATVARRASKDPTSVNGGELPFTQRDNLNAEIGAVAFALAPGQLAPFPVRSSGAWYIVKTEERRTGPTPRFVAIREQLLRYLQRDGIPAIAKAALDKVTVRTYTMSGKEVADEPR